MKAHIVIFNKGSAIGLRLCAHYLSCSWKWESGNRIYPYFSLKVWEILGQWGRCLLNPCDCVNDLPHSSQWNRFWPSCTVATCLLMELAEVNVLGHLGHSCGLSFLWKLWRCSRRLSLELNVLLQTSHWWDFWLSCSSFKEPIHITK